MDDPLRKSDLFEPVCNTGRLATVREGRNPLLSDEVVYLTAIVGALPDPVPRRGESNERSSTRGAMLPVPQEDGARYADAYRSAPSLPELPAHARWGPFRIQATRAGRRRVLVGEKRPLSGRARFDLRRGCRGWRYSVDTIHGRQVRLSRRSCAVANATVGRDRRAGRIKESRSRCRAGSFSSRPVAVGHHRLIPAK